MLFSPVEQVVECDFFVGIECRQNEHIQFLVYVFGYRYTFATIGSQGLYLLNLVPHPPTCKFYTKNARSLQKIMNGILIF